MVLEFFHPVDLNLIQQNAQIFIVVCNNLWGQIVKNQIEPQIVDWNLFPDFLIKNSLILRWFFWFFFSDLCL